MAFIDHTNGGPWLHWTSCTTSSTTDTIWIQWSGESSTATTSTATCTTTWRQWNSVEFVLDVTTPAQEAAARRAVEEHARRLEQQMDEQRERQRVEAEVYRKAKERSEGFLYENLTDEQRAQMKRDKFFVVQGGRSGKRYRIDASGGHTANVHEIDGNGRVTRRLCAHLEYAANAPVYDHFLAQKLMLQYQEDAFLRIANAH